MNNSFVNLSSSSRLQFYRSVSGALFDRQNLEAGRPGHGRIIPKCLALLALLLMAALPALAAEFYAAPAGSPSGNGSQASPWDLQTALNQPAAVHPGDTIWLLGGTYRAANRPTKFVSYLAGAPGLPITVRALPGARATIDGNLGQYTGGWVNYWGLEIMDSQQFGPGISPTRTTDQSGPFPTTWWALYDGKYTDFCVSGVDLEAPNCKLINLVVHDNIGGGFGLDIAAGNTEIYGSLSYYNGWQSTVDRGHGHGIYGQNAAPAVKHITDCLVLDNFALGMQATGAGPTPVADDFDVEGTAFFLNGALATRHQANLLIGAFQGYAQNPVVRTNFIYDTMGSGSDFNMGYDGGSVGAIVEGNYFQTSAQFGDNVGITIQGNTFLSGTIGLNEGAYPDNDYATSPPTANVVFVRPNQYEPGRANLIIYNWQLLGTVAVDVSAVLPVGTAYEVRNAQDFYGAPVLSGTYEGGALNLPMTGLAVAPPVGIGAPPASGPNFNAFVLLPLGAVTSTPPADAAPTISAIANQTAVPITATPAIPFTIGDADTSLASLTLTGTSSDTAVVRNPNIVFGGSGANRTVTLTPPPGASGATTITIVVSDGVKSASTSFNLTVAAEAPPTISSIANQTTAVNIATPAIAFTLADAYVSPANLTLAVASSNAGLVPNSNIVLGGSGANRTVTLTPAANQTGTATITISAGDGIETANTSFTLSVAAATPPTQKVYIPLQAAAGTIVSPMTVSTDNTQNPSVSYVSSPTANLGSDTFTVNITVPGVYVIWGRVLSPSGASDSFFVSVDGGPEDVYDDAEGTWSSAWQWTVVNGRGGTGVPLTLDPRTFNLSQGTHQITFSAREVNATLNQILISNDLGFVPQTQTLTAANQSLTGAANQTTLFPESTFLANAINLAGGTLTPSLPGVYSTQGGTLTECGGTVFYTPKAGFTGTDTFNFTLADGQGDTSSAVATVTVQ